MGRMKVKDASGEVECPVSFLLGFGAQKSGSTWLYRFLQSHPEAEMGSWKEYGFWDHYLLNDTGRQLEYGVRLNAILEKESEGNVDLLSASERNQKAGLSLALELMGKLPQYLEHFCGLAHSRPTVRLVGDITPSYCRLGSENLREINSVIRGAGFVPKPVFILRDPATRILSALDMKLRRQRRDVKLLSDSELEGEILEMATSPGAKVRTAYRHTVKSLEEGFGVGNVFFGFYETFFSIGEMSRLLDFLNLSWLNPPFQTRVNRAKNSACLRGDIKRQIRELYSEEYEYCDRRFPEAKLDQLWC